jgi:hypothetical protein
VSDDARLRLHKSLDKRALVPHERDAVTGHLVGHAREQKDSRSHPRRPHRVRHLLRTPAGAVGGVALVVAAVVVGIVVAGAGSDKTAPAALVSTPGSSTASIPAVVPSSAPPAVTGAALPPPCDLLTQDVADAAAGPVTLTNHTPAGCSYFSAGNRKTVGLLYTPTAASAPSREGRPETVVPALGAGAVSVPALDRPKQDGHQFFPADVYLPVGSQYVTVFLGSSDGNSHATDPAGDERRATALAIQLFGTYFVDNGGGAIVYS